MVCGDRKAMRVVVGSWKGKGQKEVEEGIQGRWRWR
jgi:hypothetical protein